MKPLSLLIAAACLLSSISAFGQGPGRGKGRGMPEAERKAIHGLFEAHDKITRKVEVTEKGYVATTTSEDTKVVALLQSHVAQMKKRLDSGLRARRWDPAFDEYVEHYDAMKIRIRKIANGVRIEATGKTPESRKVLRNHAVVISAFVENGWEEHDARHPRALDPKADKEERKKPAKSSESEAATRKKP